MSLCVDEFRNYGEAINNQKPINTLTHSTILDRHWTFFYIGRMRNFFSLFFKNSRNYRGLLSLFVVGLVVFLSSKSVYADLTKQDIEEIRKIVKEEGQILRQEMQKEVQALRQEMQQGFFYINKRIEDLRGFLYVILAGIFALVGFVLWDRRTAITPAVKKTNILEEKEERLERALKEFALKEPRLAEALRYAGVV